MGLYNSNFTRRTSALAFQLSCTSVVDHIKHWKRAISLAYPSFLEALARAADMVFIPSPAHLDMVGKEDIVSFYILMDSTGLWDSFVSAQHKATTRLSIWSTHAQDTDPGVGDTTGVRVRPGEDPTTELSYRLEQFLQLVNAMHLRAERRVKEGHIWQRSPAPTTKGVGSSISPSGATGTKDHTSGRRVSQLRRRSRAASTINTSSIVAGVSLSDAANKPRSGMGGDESSEKREGTKVSKGVRQVTDEEKKEQGDQASPRFEEAVGSMLHDVWRTSRGRVAGTSQYIPRIKTINGIEYDIANLPFHELPAFFKFENLLAAHAACESIREAWSDYYDELENEEEGRDTLVNANSKTGKGLPPDSSPSGSPESGSLHRHEAFFHYLRSPEFVDLASAEQHECWLKRNKHSAWVTKEQRKDYDSLPNDEKEKVGISQCS